MGRASSHSVQHTSPLCLSASVSPPQQGGAPRPGEVWKGQRQEVREWAPPAACVMRPPAGKVIVPLLGHSTAMGVSLPPLGRVPGSHARAMVTFLGAPQGAAGLTVSWLPEGWGAQEGAPFTAHLQLPRVSLPPTASLWYQAAGDLASLCLTGVLWPRTERQDGRRWRLLGRNMDRAAVNPCGEARLPAKGCSVSHVMNTTRRFHGSVAL